MWQQLIALLIILFFIWRLIIQKKKQKITKNEFNFWLVFWSIAALAILALKFIDRLVIKLGLSGAGINYLLYIAVLILFYLLFRTRLKIVKIERDITRITREEALKE